MDVYRTEEEQIELIKAWWKQYGTSLLLGIAVVVAVVFGWRYWQQHETTLREQASSEYEQLLIAQGNDDKANARALANNLFEKYHGTPYGKLAALFLAKMDVDAGKLPEAETKLKSVMNESSNAALQQIARLRAARVLLGEKKPKEALALLQTVNSKAFETSIAEVKGDIYYAMGDRKQARLAYQQAIKSQPSIDIMRPVLRMKYDDLAMPTHMADQQEGKHV